MVYVWNLIICCVAARHTLHDIPKHCLIFWSIFLSLTPVDWLRRLHRARDLYPVLCDLPAFILVKLMGGSLKESQRVHSFIKAKRLHAHEFSLVVNVVFDQQLTSSSSRHLELEIAWLHFDWSKNKMEAKFEDKIDDEAKRSWDSVQFSLFFLPWWCAFLESTTSCSTKGVLWMMWMFVLCLIGFQI